MKPYEDTYLRSRVQAVIEHQKKGEILVDACKSACGLPSKDELGMALRRGPYPYDFQLGDLGYLDYERDSGMYRYIARPGTELPPALQDYKPLTLAEAVLNPATRTARITTDDAGIIFSAVQVWERGYTLISEINSELSRQKTGIVVWRLTWEEVSGGPDGLFPENAPRLSNAHAYVSLTGYALDKDTRVLVYFGCVGYKTSIESIRASLVIQKPVTLALSNEPGMMVVPAERYESLYQAMPEYTHHHACFVNRTVIPGAWELEDSTAYLLAFHGCPDIPAELQRLFIDRLGEALEAPILPQWAAILWKEAVSMGYVQPLQTGGDCMAGARLDLKADWKAMIETLLQEDVLQIS